MVKPNFSIFPQEPKNKNSTDASYGNLEMFENNYITSGRLLLQHRHLDTDTDTPYLVDNGITSRRWRSQGFHRKAAQ